jgi:hypothetical protein
MAFIGNQPISAAFLTDTFSGNGSTVAFTMTVAPANTSSIIVAVTGVLQDPSTYSVSGTTLTFSAAPPSGTSNISVRYLGIPASGVTTTAYRTVTNFTATAGQTSFSVPSYTVGYIDVYRNGVRLVSTDYTATTGTTVVLNNACTVGDSVVTESFLVSSVLNAIPATAGSVSDSYIVDVSASKLTGSRTIPKGTMPAGAVLQVVQTAKTDTFTTTSTSFTDVTGLSVSITPSSATSKIFITTSFEFGMSSGSGYPQFRMLRDSTVINAGASAGSRTLGILSMGGGIWNSDSATGLMCASSFVDSPATTSATTYKIQARQSSGATVYVGANSGDADSAASLRGSSNIIVMEIAV